MRKFLRNLLLALIPVAVINALCWGTLVFLAWQDDLTYVNYASALDKEKRLEELGNQSRLLIIGGSNARFGFDSSILRDTLHLEPVNMGIHIGLGLNYMFEEVYDHLRKGDVLLVSAEYNHYIWYELPYSPVYLLYPYLSVLHVYESSDTSKKNYVYLPYYIRPFPIHALSDTYQSDLHPHNNCPP